MSDIYLLVKLDESSPLLRGAQDDDVAAEAIYWDCLKPVLAVVGVELVALEMSDNFDGTIVDEMLGINGPRKAP